MLQEFSFESGNIRTIEKDGEIWFIAKDIAKSLGYSRERDAISDHCKGAVKWSLLTKGGKQQMHVIPESDVYRLISRSKLPNALKFQDWVFGEVIPSIRKTGKYDIADKSLKSKSKKDRNLLTEQWQDHGADKPHHFRNLTLREYKNLGFDKSLRKDKMNKDQILALNALESMETFKLSQSGVKGYYDLAESLDETGLMLMNMVRGITRKELERIK